MKSFLKSLMDDRSGATAIEYGLIASLIVIGAMSAINGFAGEIIKIFGEVESKSAEARKGG